MKKKQNANNPAEEAFKEGYGIVRANPILGPLLRRADAFFNDSYPMARDDWAWVNSKGQIYANFHRRASPQNWAYVLAHCLLHLALGHIREDRDGDPLWNAACDCTAAR